MIACRRRGAFCKGITCTPARRGPTFVRAKVGKTRSRGTDSPLTNPFLSLAVLDTNLDFSGAKNPNPYCAQIRSQGSRRRICPHRLAVPEKIFALLACSIFSTATDAPPRCIRHWRCSAPHPHPPRPPHPPNLHNKSQLYFPSKIHYLCNIHPAFPHNVNFPLKVVKY